MNKAAERIFGYTEAEALGKRMDLITPERFRHWHWEGYEKSMETGITRYGTQLLKVPALHKDGRTLSIVFTVSMLFDEAHHATGVAATICDEKNGFMRIAHYEIDFQSLRAPLIQRYQSSPEMVLGARLNKVKEGNAAYADW